jgi:hypothetical protein
LSWNSAVFLCRSKSCEFWVVEAHEMKGSLTAQSEGVDLDAILIPIGSNSSEPCREP